MNQEKIAISFSVHEPLTMREEVLCSLLGGILYALSNYTIRHSPRELKKCLGYTNFDKKEIVIGPCQGFYGKKIEVILHELLHAMNPKTKHLQIYAICQSMLELLTTRLHVGDK